MSNATTRERVINDFYNLHKKEVTRSQIASIRDRAKKQSLKDIHTRLSKVLKENDDPVFTITISGYETAIEVGMNGVMSCSTAGAKLKSDRSSNAGAILGSSKCKSGSKKSIEKIEKKEIDSLFKIKDEVKFKSLADAHVYEVIQADYKNGEWFYNIKNPYKGIEEDISEKELIKIKEIVKIPISDQISYEQFNELFKNVENGIISLEDFKKLYTSLANSVDKIKEGINKAYTVADLKRYSFHRSEKKSFYVKQYYDQLLMRFSNGTVSYGFNEKLVDVVGSMVMGANQKYLEEIFARYQRFEEQKKQTKKTREQAKNNPKTLEEYKIFLAKYGTLKDLTDEQLERLDKMMAKRRFDEIDNKIVKDAERRFSNVSNTDISGVQFELNETTHSRKGHDLFVVSMVDRVEKDVYRTLVATAKSMGGYYSSYSKEGAIPGFQFMSKEVADEFMSKTSKNEPPIDPKDVLKVRKKKRLEQYDKLIDLLKNRIKKNQEYIDAPRLTNTNKRAREAASGIKSSLQDIAVSKAGIEVVKCVKAGNCFALKELTAMTELDQLHSMIRMAVSEYRNSIGVKSHDKSINELINETDFKEIVHFIKAPKLEFYGRHIEELIDEVETIKGFKLLSKRIVKKLVENKRGDHVYYSLSPRYLDDIEKIVKASKTYSYSMVKDRIETFKRAYNGLGFKSMHIVRQACREYYDSLKSSGIYSDKRSNKAKDIEVLNNIRSRKIPGFFPTPEPLVKKILNNIKVYDDDTILEPSAGIGNIASVLKKQFPNNDLQLIEFNTDLYNYLKTKGYNVLNQSFLDYKVKHDVIVMNPPFEKDQDIDHVMHAFNLLRPDGRLIAIMAANKSRSSRKKRQEFEKFLNANGWYEENPAGSFNSSFMPTGVNTITVYLEKSNEDIDNSKPKNVKNVKPTKEKKTFTGVKSMNLRSINTDPKRFQNRSKLNENIVNSIVDNFKPTDLDPLVIWKDPQDDKYYLLAGHHRFAALKKLNHKTVPVKVANKDYPSEKDAIRYARELSNANRTLETPVERAKIYRAKMMAGESLKEIEKAALKEGKNKSYILNLMFLNPQGRVIEALERFNSVTDKQNSNEIEKQADWIGAARKQFRNLTNAHESEMFTFLNDVGSSKRITIKVAFLQYINSIASGFDMDYSKPLNLKRFKYKSQGENSYESEVSSIKEKIQQNQNSIDDIKARFLNPKSSNYVKPSHKDYDDMKRIADNKIAEYNTVIKSLQQELSNLYQNKSSFINAGSNQIGMFAPAVTMDMQVNPIAYHEDINDIAVVPEPVKPKRSDISNMPMEIPAGAPVVNTEKPVNNEKAAFDLSDIGFTKATDAPDEPEGLFQLPGEIGAFLQELQSYQALILIKGTKHTSKSQLAMQIANAIGEAGKKVGYIDYEQGGVQSKDTINSLKWNTTPQGKENIFIVGELDDPYNKLRNYCKHFFAIVADSVTDLGITPDQLSDLRKEFPYVVWIFISQVKENGAMYGGNKMAHNPTAIIECFPHSDPKFRYATLEKNRGNSLDKYYSMYYKKLIPNPADVPIEELAKEKATQVYM